MQSAQESLAAQAMLKAMINHPGYSSLFRNHINRHSDH